MAENNSPKITNQHDIDDYIDRKIMTAEKEIEILFANRLKEITEIADMFLNTNLTTLYVTWTEFNKYNRLNRNLIV